MEESKTGESSRLETLYKDCKAKLDAITRDAEEVTMGNGRKIYAENLRRLYPLNVKRAGTGSALFQANDLVMSEYFDLLEKEAP